MFQTFLISLLFFNNNANLELQPICASFKIVFLAKLLLLVNFCLSLRIIALACQQKKDKYFSPL